MGEQVTGSYDGQVADASKQLTGNGQAAVNFGQSYYNQNLVPRLAAQNAQANTSQTSLNNTANTDSGVQSTQAGLANGLGAQAQTNLYNMAQNYNSPEEFERQAQLAKGDVGQAEANQQLATQQRANSYGTDPNSGQSQALSAQNQVSNVATEAQAMNNARNAARTLGMQLTQTAAGQGNQNVSNAVQAGQGATGASTGAFGVAQGNTNTAGTIGQQQQTAYQTANQAFGQNLSTYGGLDNASINANSQNTLGSTLGALGGQVLGAAMPGGGTLAGAFGKAAMGAVGLGGNNINQTAFKIPKTVGGVTSSGANS